ncbi:MAG TPA: hypothetical protein VJA94_02730, partial [Candidatus Angelobacter sp.]
TYAENGRILTKKHYEGGLLIDDKKYAVAESTEEDDSKHVTERYAVYSAFLADEIERNPDLPKQGKIHFVLKLHPIAIAPDSEQARALERAFPAGLLREDTRANFIRVVGQEQTLKPLFQLPKRARYSLDEQKREPRDPNAANVYVSLSPIGLSDDGKQALLYAGLWYNECVSGDYVLLEKKASVWKVMQGINMVICT